MISRVEYLACKLHLPIKSPIRHMIINTVLSVTRTTLPSTVSSVHSLSVCIPRRWLHASGIGMAQGPGKTKQGDGAPFRYPLEWNTIDFYDEAKLEDEMRRVLDVCHGCRRCFNLCSSFPNLFQLVDNSTTGELDAVPSKAFKSVVDECTLCDMCFMTKCPYVPPHSWNIDFPHLMLRYKAVENWKKNATEINPTVKSIQPTFPPQKTEPNTPRELALAPKGLVHSLLANTDLLGKFNSMMAPLANWITKEGSPARPLLERLTGIHKEAALPSYVPASATLMNQTKKVPAPANTKAPAYGKRKVVLYATCMGNYNKPSMGLAARAVLAHNGVEVKTVYPQCCGMPSLEEGNVKEVAARAKKITDVLARYVDEGYDVVSTVASCTLMIKQEWPLILPNDENVKKVAKRTFDVAQYVLDISKKEGLVDGLRPVNAEITLHHACHARAQNMGWKSQELLKLIPNAKISAIERCSGHGGSFGVKKETFPSAVAVGTPVFKQALQSKQNCTEKVMYVASDCPLAADHIKQGITITEKDEPSQSTQPTVETRHPIEILASAYNIKDGTLPPIA